MKKRLILLLTVLIMCVNVSGCGTDLQSFAKNTYPQAIQERVNSNIRIAEKFNSLGALSDESLNSLKTHMQQQANKYKTTDNKTASLLGSAVSEYKALDGSTGLPKYVTLIDDDGVSHDIYYDNPILPLPTGDKNVDYIWKKSVVKNLNTSPSIDELHLGHFVISNYLASTKFNSKWYNNNEWYTRDDADVKPIELVSEDVKDEINKNLKAQIYILRSDIATIDGMSTVDGIMSMVNQACAGDKIDTKIIKFNPKDKRISLGLPTDDVSVSE